MSLAVSPPSLRSRPCFDAGSSYCPCDLATLGACVACSLLRGEEKCDCGWSEICIYQEFLRGGGTVKPRRRQLLARVKGRAEVQSPAGAHEGAFMIDLEVPGEVSRWCVFPGSFALLRPKGSPERFNVPLSVMETRDNLLRFAVEVKGPKTRALDKACVPGAGVNIVAPFWSGLQGAVSLRRFAAGRVLGIAKGIGQAPLVNASQYVLAHGGSFKSLLGAGTLGRVFVEDALKDGGAQVEVLLRTKDHNLARFYTEFASGAYDLVLSEGSDRQHESLRNLLSSLDDPPAFAWSSNFSMTCAEGICGACLKDGFRGCKADIS